MSTAQIPTMDAKVRQFAAQFQYSILAAVLMSICPLRALAQDMTIAHDKQQELTPDQKSQQGELIKIVREATERFKDVAAAETGGYTLTFGCVSGPDQGAMGLHYVNFDLVGTGVIDPAQPQIVIYEATARRTPETDRRRLSGRCRAVGLDRSTGIRRNSWDSSFTSSMPPIASACPRFTHCTSGHGRTTRTVRS